ncbi:hypothetical protein F4604DRAFT_1917646 [Suillus subluteus]|nr:hypothetical protein F4604DRAFT_1917646 [Suillus subluteus]
MAAASSSSALSLAPLVSLAVSDQELPDDGTHLSCLPELLRKFFGFVKVSLDRVRPAVRDQYPVGRLLPVTASAVRHEVVLENFPYMTLGNYAACHYRSRTFLSRSDT